MVLTEKDAAVVPAVGEGWQSRAPLSSGYRQVGIMLDIAHGGMAGSAAP